MTELTRYSPHPDVMVFVGSPLKVNVSVLIGGDEAVVVDSTATVAQARQVYSHVVDELGLRVVTVVNTHWHSDHCGGNAGLTAAGAPVIAHQRHFETISLERNMVSRRPARIAFERLVRPRITMDRRLDLRLGKRTVHLLHAPGHSPDLVMVWDPSRGCPHRLGQPPRRRPTRRPDHPLFLLGGPVATHRRPGARPVALAGAHHSGARCSVAR